MKKFTVLIIALLLIISFCSCKSQSNIPVINTSEQSDSSDITESQVENSKPVISNTSSTQSTPKENSSKPSSNIESSTPSASSNSSTPVPNKPEEPVTKQDFKICYAQLTDKQKSIYNTLEKAVKDMETGWISLETPVYTNYRRDINIIVAALQTDMPQYFWIPPAYYTGNSQDGDTIRILFEGQCSFSQGSGNNVPSYRHHPL